MQSMTNPKLDKALRLLVAIEREPQSSYALADTLETSRAPVIRLVANLRELGCGIEAEREGKGDWAYHLRDWGMFAPARVRRRVEGVK